MSFPAETVDGEIVEIESKRLDAERNLTVLVDVDGEEWASSPDEALKLKPVAEVMRDLRQERLADVEARGGEGTEEVSRTGESEADEPAPKRSRAKASA